MAYVRTLSLSDAKTRSQKFGKTMEEMGELARVLLPLENAPGSQHDIWPRVKMLEECCDGILCLLSLAYADGFDDDAVEAMLSRKADKWGEKQEAEGRGKGVFPFEIHVSVPPDCSEDEFRSACAVAGVKPLVLVLDDGHGRMRRDVMTSSTFSGTNLEAVDEMARISSTVAKFGVCREKIETVPWHPRAPRNSQEDNSMPVGCYFEAHLSVRVLNTDISNLCIEQSARGLSCSVNSRKRGEESSVVMLTMRRRSGTREDFARDVELTLASLAMKPDEVNTEFAVWDTDPFHDDA